MSKVSIESSIKKANGFTYILLIYYNESCDIVVGRLGHVKINKGYYIYIGSAKKNINSRLNRHLSAKKNKFWHIDYVLSNPFPFLIVNIWTSQELIECQISKELFKSNYCYLVKKGFEVDNHLWGIYGIKQTELTGKEGIKQLEEIAKRMLMVNPQYG